MSTKNILITGWLWYIGSHTIVELYDAGYQVVIIDNLSNSSSNVLARLEKLTQQKLPYYQWDIRDEVILGQIFEDYQINAVIHFAAKKSVSESMEQPFEYYDNNLNGTLTLTRMMDKYGVRNLLFSGTCAVYSPDEQPPYHEKSLVWPESVYAITKRMDEELFEGLYKTNHLSTLVLRYFNPIGNHESALIGEVPHGVPQNLMPYLMQVINGTRTELSIYGDDYDTIDGTAVRDYIHVVDLAQAHVKALDYLLSREESYYDIINIWTGQGTSVMQMIQAVESVTWAPFAYRIVDRRSGDLPLVYGDVRKAQEVLWRKAQKSLDDGIRDMLKFYSEL